MGQLRSSEWNNIAFAKTPQDVAKLCRDRLAFHDLDDMRIVDSECRLAALEALLLLVDAGPLSAATVAARRNVVDLAAAVIAAAHARAAEPPRVGERAGGTACGPTARLRARARGLCCVGRLPSDIAAPPPYRRRTTRGMIGAASIGAGRDGAHRGGAAGGIGPRGHRRQARVKAARRY